LLGTVFVIAGLAKLAHRARFEDTLAAMEILPVWLVRWVARLLAPVEVVLGVTVAAGWWPGMSGRLLLGLVGVFLVGLAWYRLRGGKQLVCGCFADFEQKTPTVRLIGRNLVLFAVGLPLLFPMAEPAARPGVLAWVLATTVVLGLLLAWGLAGGLVETVGLLRVQLSAGDGREMP
jgi:hypothetical protein